MVEKGIQFAHEGKIAQHHRCVASGLPPHFVRSSFEQADLIEEPGIFKDHHDHDSRFPGHFVPPAVNLLLGPALGHQPPPELGRGLNALLKGRYQALGPCFGRVGILVNSIDDIGDEFSPSLHMVQDKSPGKSSLNIYLVMPQ